MTEKKSLRGKESALSPSCSPTKQHSRLQSSGGGLLSPSGKSAAQNRFLIPSHLQPSVVDVSYYIGDYELSALECGNGPIIILVHGWQSTSALWLSQIKFLAASGFRVIAPDLRGFGNSTITKGTESYSLENLSKDLLNLLDHLLLRSAFFVGHSFGGSVVSAFARKYPTRVNGIVLLNSRLFLNDIGAEEKGSIKTEIPKNFYEQYVFPYGINEKDLEQDIEKTLHLLMRDNENSKIPFHEALKSTSETDLRPKFCSKELLQIFTKQFSHTGFYASLSVFQNAPQNALFLGKRELIPCPVLAISVGADPLCPSQTFPLTPSEEKWAPNVTRFFLPGCSSFPMLENPSKFNRVLLEWLLTISN
eukprot:g2081.t1